MLLFKKGNKQQQKQQKRDHHATRWKELLDKLNFCRAKKDGFCWLNLTTGQFFKHLCCKRFGFAAKCSFLLKSIILHEPQRDSQVGFFHPLDSHTPRNEGVTWFIQRSRTSLTQVPLAILKPNLILSKLQHNWKRKPKKPPSLVGPKSAKSSTATIFQQWNLFRLTVWWISLPAL